MTITSTDQSSVSTINQQRWNQALNDQLMRIAREAIVETVECEGLAIDIAGHTYYDMRPALDNLRFADEEVSWVRDQVGAGIDAGLLIPASADQPRIVRINPDMI